MKNHSPGRWLPSAVLALLLLPAAAAAQPTIARGQPWEQTITSTTSYAGAWLSTRLCVQYTSPSSPHTVYTGLGFWDAPNGSASDFFKIRAAFNETGPWSWALVAGTGCAPPGNFSPASGSVTVNPDATGLPLYQYGPVRVGSPKRFLVYSGAPLLTPFVWIGDTSWSGSYISNVSTWQSFTLKRMQEQFSVIQTALPVVDGGIAADVTGRPAFVTTPGGATACPAATVLPSPACYPNKAFWDFFDRHIADVNAKGMLAVVVALFEPVNDQTNWPAVADSQGYARWVAARLAGYYTALSPGFDGLPARGKSFTETNCGGVSGSALNLACRARMVGTAIREATPENATVGPLTALVTHHMGGGCSDGLDGSTPATQCLADSWLAQFQNETWLDLQLFQSSQGDNCVSPKLPIDCLAERASQRPRTLYDAATAKPLVDGEAIYDQFGFRKPQVPDPLYVDYYGRLAAFYTLLSGGAGFTHGIAGTWDWNGYYTQQPAATGIGAASAVEIGAIGQLFAPFRWNRLVPDCQPWASACSHIKSSDQATLPAESKRVYSRDSSGLFAVAYVPGSSAAPLSSITLDLADLASFSTNLGAPWSTEWFDPARSCYCTATASGSGPYTFSSPKSNADWALVIRNTTSFPPPASRTPCNPPTGSTISCSGRP